MMVMICCTSIRRPSVSKNAMTTTRESHIWKNWWRTRTGRKEWHDNSQRRSALLHYKLSFTTALLSYHLLLYFYFCVFTAALAFCHSVLQYSLALYFLC